ncbi:MAG: outer membrane beta-barrel protein [Bacteroidales bacterium]
MTRLNDRDQLDDILQSKLYNVESTPPPFDWDRLELKAAPTRKVVKWWGYVAGTAAAAVILMLLMLRPTEETMTNPIIISKDEPVETHTIEHTIPEPIVVEPTMVAKADAVSMVRQIIDMANPDHLNNLTILNESALVSKDADLSAEPTIAQATPSYQKSKEEPIHPLDKLAMEEESSSLQNVQLSNKKSRMSWLVGINGGSGGGLSTTETGARMSNSALLKGGLAEIDQSNILNTKVNAVRLQHDIPLSFGLTVRKSIAPRWAIESGLSYTYMRSQGRMEGIMPYTVRQYLHYIGVPVSVNYTILEYKRFSVYAAVGGTVERCISAERITTFDEKSVPNQEINDRLPINDFDYSLNAKVGASLDFADHVGMYVEPTANYYFSNDDKIDNYRKDNPFGVSFKLGLFVKF